MKAFLTRLMIFLTATACSLMALAYLGGVLLKNKGPFRMPEDKRYVFMGHSQTEYAYDASVIDSCINLGAAGEAYLYTYVKVAELIRENPGRRMTLLVTFSNNNLGSNMDDWTWGDVYIQDRYRRFHAFTGLAERKLLYTNNLRRAVLTDLQSPFYNYYDLFMLGDLRKPGLIGGFEALTWNRVDSLVRNPPKQASREAYIKDMSQVNLTYLRKIIQYCREHEVEIYLVRGPLHKAYPLRNVDDIFQEVRKKQFSDVEFLDLQDFPLQDAEFADLEHVNVKGADKLSRTLAQWMRDGLLTAANKQAYIDEKIARGITRP